MKFNCIRTQLFRFATVYAAVVNVNVNSLRGILDNGNKIKCAYLAHKHLNLGYKVLGDFFNIDKFYLRNQIEGLQLESSEVKLMGDVILIWDCLIGKEKASA